jgi:succinoglycan biosynthesis protein ExoM
VAETTAIDVCIATFKRPQVLSKLLESLCRQDLHEVSMRIVVIDNDEAQSARSVVAEFGRRYGIPLLYDVEPRQNIALARNRALRHVQADYFAFVDDDEIVCKSWLHKLLNSMHQYQVDIVFGPVISTLPQHAPAWAQANFKRARYPTGQCLHTGGAGNVLIRRSVIDGIAQPFDPAFGLTGGEDTDFFYRMHLDGKRLIWCDEAWAKEPVAADRLSPEWLRRRGFRSGQNYFRIFVSRYAAHKMPLWFVVKTAQLAGATVALPLVRLLSYPKYIALTVRIAAASGQLSYCFSGKNYEEYRVRSCR